MALSGKQREIEPRPRILRPPALAVYPADQDLCFRIFMSGGEQGMLYGSSDQSTTVVPCIGDSVSRYSFDQRDRYSNLDRIC